MHSVLMKSTVIDGGRVTTTELLAELTTARGMFDWRVDKKGRLRGHLTKDARLAFDPVTAIAYLQTGQFFPEGHWADAAAAIGLSYFDCADIVAACNYEWDPSCRQGVLRREFLNLVQQESNAAHELKHASAFTILGRKLRKRMVMTVH
jgi:hypothetical protein